jgi:hypothetical protein
MSGTYAATAWRAPSELRPVVDDEAGPWCDREASLNESDFCCLCRWLAPVRPQVRTPPVLRPRVQWRLNLARSLPVRPLPAGLGRADAR